MNGDAAMSNTTDPPKLRNVDYLTPQQLQRKREVDRKSQRLARERTKSYISELEQKVREFENRILDLEQFITKCTCRGRPQQQLRACEVPKGQSWQLPSPEHEPPPIDTQQVPDAFGGQCDVIQSEENWVDQSISEELIRMINDSGPGTDFSLWTRVFDDTFATSQGLSQTALPEVAPPEAFAQHSISGPAIWQTLPKHTLPTCALDSVVLNLIDSRRRLEPIGGNDIEFKNRSFPSVQSLLNPKYESVRTPVISHIVNNIIHVMTVSQLPEQIAVLFVMSSVIRWQISPTEANYDRMPEWLRPTPSQLVGEHPFWLDVLPFPKARERCCRWQKYHLKHPEVSKIFNETLSINWPHKPSDMIVQVGDDIILNPMFEKHIHDIRNWSVGKQILDLFPEWEGDINIGPSRLR